MSEEKEPRKIQAQCDFCDQENGDVTVIILADKTVMLLCDNHLELLKKFCEKIDRKWSEITL